jgi:cation diffusion facilitator CzcD-associated flavoprotein CzcO
MSINDIDIQQSNDDYVNHEQYLSYLKQFDCENIAYEVEVLSAEQLEGGWRITTSQGVEEFAALIVCSGHYVSPNIPADFDKFTCRVIHSCQYKEPSPFRGERVLIVGAGSSAIQIASDLVEVAESIFISTRKMPYVLPRYVNGKTLLSFHREVKDLSESEILAQLKEAGVDQSLYGLPPPQQSLLGSTTLPIGDAIFKQVQNGDVKFISEIIAIY